MQSILLTAPAKQVNSKEPLSEIPVPQESVEGESLPVEKNLAINFSELLNSALAESNEDGQAEEGTDEPSQATAESADENSAESEELNISAASADELDLNVTESDELDISLAGTNELAVSAADADKLDLTVTDVAAENLDITNVVQNNTGKKTVVESSQTEKLESITTDSNHFVHKQSPQEKSVKYSDSELFSEESLIEKKTEPQPILAQIEAAQKADTKITDTEKKGTFSVENSKLLTAVKKTEEKPLLKDEKSLLVTELPLKTVDEKAILDESLKMESKLPMFDKVANALTSKNETTQPLLNNPIDNNGSSVLNANNSQLNKLVNSHLQNSHQSTQLQQPLELQAKNGSAQVGERILMMINQGKQEVSIRLDPAELGSMTIKLQIQQEQVQLTIQTQAGLSRDIIEQNLPRLREQLLQQGINLGETSVEQQGQQQKQSQQDKNSVQNAAVSVNSDHLHSDVDEQNEWLSGKIPLLAQGIDYYA